MNPETDVTVTYLLRHILRCGERLLDFLDRFDLDELDDEELGAVCDAAITASFAIASLENAVMVPGPTPAECHVSMGSLSDLAVQSRLPHR